MRVLKQHSKAKENRLDFYTNENEKKSAGISITRFELQQKKINKRDNNKGQRIWYTKAAYHDITKASHINEE